MIQQPLFDKETTMRLLNILVVYLMICSGGFLLMAGEKAFIYVDKFYESNDIKDAELAVNKINETFSNKDFDAVEVFYYSYKLLKMMNKKKLTDLPTPEISVGIEGYRSGVDPNSIKDIHVREKYLKAIKENNTKIEIVKYQRKLEKLRIKLISIIKKNSPSVVKSLK